MAKGRTEKSVRNIIYRMMSHLFTILLKFTERTVFIHILGAEYLGINGLFGNVLQVLSLADLGFGTAMVFSMYRPLALGDKQKLTQLTQFYKNIYRIIAVAISAIGIAIIPLLPYLVNLESDMPYLRVYYLLYLANTVASYLVVYKTCILIADQKSYILAKNSMIFSFLSTGFCTVFLYITKKFMVYLIIQVLFTYMINFYNSHVTTKLYPYITAKTEPLPKNDRKSIYLNIKSMFIYKLANMLVGSTDNMIISVLLGTIVVGYYSNYAMVINNIQALITIVFSSITASLGNLITESNKDKNYEVYKKIQIISFILSTVAIGGVYLLINDFIYIWIGEQYMLDHLSVIAMTVNLYFSVILMPVWSYREATGMYQRTKYVMVATTIVNIVFSIVLGKVLGLAGVLFATSVARLSTYFLYEPKILFKEYFNASYGSYYISILKNIFISIVITSIMELLLGGMRADSIWGFIIKLAAVAMMGLGLSVAAYCRNSEFKQLLGKYRRRM